MSEPREAELRRVLEDVLDAIDEHINALTAWIDPQNQYTESRFNAMRESMVSLGTIADQAEVALR